VKGDGGNMHYVSEQDLDTFWSRQGDWEKRRNFLYDKRREFDRNRTDKMKARLAANLDRTELTKKMVDLATKQHSMQAIQIAYGFTFPYITSSSHVIFILDESGSMEGDRWSGLQKSFGSYCKILQSHEASANDLVSVIQFQDDAHVVKSKISIDDASRLSLSKRGEGGTKFGPAMALALELVKQDALSKTDVVLVFMTDGENQDKDEAVEILRDIFRTCDSRNPKFHAIFIGDVKKPPESLMKMVAAVGNDGVLYNAKDTVQLERRFVEIAEAMCVSDRSVERARKRQ
jgi:Mg-chelatase subunit ChlD